MTYYPMGLETGSITYEFYRASVTRGSISP